MARPAWPERSRSARSSRQLSRFYHSINPDRVFGTHTSLARKPIFRFGIASPAVLGLGLRGYDNNELVFRKSCIVLSVKDPVGAGVRATAEFRDRGMHRTVLDHPKSCLYKVQSGGADRWNACLLAGSRRTGSQAWAIAVPKDGSAAQSLR